MILIFCTDSDGGMMFNSRRVSKDRLLTEYIANLARGSTLFVSSYSRKLFEGFDAVVDDSMLSHAGDGDFCFIEDIPYDLSDGRIEKLIICNWNRSYPFDKQLVPGDGWVLTDSADIRGRTHETISINTYERR